MRIFRTRTITPAQAENIRKAQERGRLRYVLLTGVLFWGGGMVVCMSIAQYWMNPEAFRIVRNVGINAIIFPIGGVFFGIWTWAIAERSYAAYLANNKETEQGGDGDADEAV